jgi:hypothetical protein
METKKNDDGTYEVVLGHSGVRTKNGLVFPAERLRNELIRLNERAKRGAMCAEVGFPQCDPGRHPAAFYDRIMEIKMDRVCARFVDFTLEDPNPENPRIVAKVIPTGPFADTARQALDGEITELYFGMRGFSNTKTVDGVTQQHIQNIVTFDLVSEQP